MTLSVATMLALSRRVDDLTARYPIGTPCRYWPMAREGPGRSGRIRSAWAVTNTGDIVVWVEGLPGHIAATHVECGSVTDE